MLCDKCETENPDNAKYCGNCGGELSNDGDEIKEPKANKNSLKVAEKIDNGSTLEKTCDTKDEQANKDSAARYLSESEECRIKPEDKKALERILKVFGIFILSVCLIFIALRVLIEYFPKVGSFDFFVTIIVLILIILFAVKKVKRNRERIDSWQKDFAKECNDYICRNSEGLEIKKTTVYCTKRELQNMKRVVEGNSKGCSPEFQQFLFDSMVVFDSDKNRYKINDKPNRDEIDWDWVPCQVLNERWVKNPIRFKLLCLLGKMVIETIPLYIYLINSESFTEMLIRTHLQLLFTSYYYAGTFVFVILPLIYSWGIWLLIFLFYQEFNLLTSKKIKVRLNYFRFLYEKYRILRAQRCRINYPWKEILKQQCKHVPNVEDLGYGVTPGNYRGRSTFSYVCRLQYRGPDWYRDHPGWNNKAGHMYAAFGPKSLYNFDEEKY